MTTLEAYNELVRLSRELLTAVDELKRDAQDAARKGNDYRRAKALAFLDIQTGTVPEKQAKVDKACTDKRLEAHLAEAIKEASVERVRSLRTVISAYQSFCSGYRAEAEFGRTGPFEMAGTGR